MKRPWFISFLLFFWLRSKGRHDRATRARGDCRRARSAATRIRTALQRKGSGQTARDDGSRIDSTCVRHGEGFVRCRAGSFSSKVISRTIADRESRGCRAGAGHSASRRLRGGTVVVIDAHSLRLRSSCDRSEGHNHRTSSCSGKRNRA